MMIVDLIDPKDFCERLASLGVDIPPGDSPGQACCRLLADLTSARRQGLQQVVDDLLNPGLTLHPQVREAVVEQLLPALRR